MAIALNTTFSLTGVAFEVGQKSLDGTVIVDINTSSIPSEGHCGIAFNRHGNRPGPGGLGGTVGSVFGDRIWHEAWGPVIGSGGRVVVEQWFRRFTGEGDFSSVEVGSVGANKLLRVTYTTSGTTREFTIHTVSALGGTIGTQLVGPIRGDTGSVSEMRSRYFSPFVFQGTAQFRCTRID